MSYTTGKLAELLEGTLEGDPKIVISGVAKIEEAKSGEITFLSNPAYKRFLSSTEASAILISDTQECSASCMIRVADPYAAFSKVLKLYYQPEALPPVGVHETAFIDKGVSLGKDIRIGARAIIGSGSLVGDESVIYPCVVIGEDVTIGKKTVIHAGVSLRFGVRIGDRVVIQDNAVIGSEGFGFAPKSSGEYEKIPQVGTVIIKDDVEIGAGCTIDRATIGSTRIEKGCKLDNLIQVAHNVVIGANTVIAAQTGISGSAEIGKNCMVGGQVGFAGHISVGDGTMIGAQSGISRSFPAGSKLFGYPARYHGEELRIRAYIKKLPQLSKEVDILKNRIAELQVKIEEK